jgi:hypothetical protein
LDNDKMFAAYLLILITGVTSTIATSVMAGFASLPSPVVFLEHVALGLTIRASYKSIGGWDWADWSIGGLPTGAASQAKELLSPPGEAANA